ncbi:hypothetical protein SY88_02725 [Clostridiales bacterium PH28_bin88]|nr:hypothetical protein SY88_02725 [Clostridiales bacterium PH28_bin88]
MLVEIEDVKKVYGGREVAVVALQGVSLHRIFIPLTVAQELFDTQQVGMVFLQAENSQRVRAQLWPVSRWMVSPG